MARSPQPGLHRAPPTALLAAACVACALTAAATCLCAAPASAASVADPTTAASVSGVPLIIDTDMDFDVDDVGALAVANALADAGEAKLLAVVHDAGYPGGVGAVSAINTWYGRQQVPIGAFKGTFGASYSGKYVDDLAGNWPSPVKNASQVPDAVAVYRAALANASVFDHSVVIASIGFLTNLAALLASPPDAISPLSGYDLVAAKVRLVAVMGGYYPRSTDLAEFNLCCGQGLMGAEDDCAGQAQRAISGMPPGVKMAFSGFKLGAAVHSGGALTSCAPEANPARQAYIDYLGPGNDRLSWDPITTLYAVRGAAACHLVEQGAGGHNVVDAAGDNQWAQGAPFNQTYLSLDGDDAAAFLGVTLDELMCRPPATPVPKPPAPPVDAGYAAAAGFNCYPGHGADSLESPPTASAGLMSIQQCQALCNATNGCAGVTVAQEASGWYQCYRKGNIHLEHCDVGTSFDTWVRGTYAHAPGFNCWPGHGGDDLESPPSSDCCGKVSVAACQAKCDATATCDGVVTSDAGGGQVLCYRKAGIVLGQCDRGTSFDTWINSAVH